LGVAAVVARGSTPGLILDKPSEEGWDGADLVVAGFARLVGVSPGTPAPGDAGARRESWNR
jgi:hypothetical protein